MYYHPEFGQDVQATPAFEHDTRIIRNGAAIGAIALYGMIFEGQDVSAFAWAGTALLALAAGTQVVRRVFGLKRPSTQPDLPPTQ